LQRKRESVLPKLRSEGRGEGSVLYSLRKESSQPRNSTLFVRSFGVNVCFSRPGTFVLMQKNNTKIVLTNQKIYGLSIFNNSTRFQVPYTSILARENFDYRLNFGLWKVMWIKYTEREKIKEVSIMGFGSNSANIMKAFDIVNVRSPSSSSR
jgi:hypothetical protein